MYLLLEKGIRGGISSVMGARHKKAFNQFTQSNCNDYRLLDQYEKDKLLKVIKDKQGDLRGTKVLSDLLRKNFILYLDANNLYGHAMSQHLPFGNFEWVDTSIEEILSTPKDSDVGYILEVDLEYTDKERTRRFPLAPEQYVSTLEDLSDYQKNLLPKDEHGNPKKLKVPKLTCNLRDKEHYVVHYSNLQFYLKMGMKLKRVHQVIKFNQRPWLKEYIDMNTQKRTVATTDFEKDCWKLMNNAFFGKTMENVRKRQEVKLVNTSESAKKLMSKPTFKKSTIFSENLAAIHQHKTTVHLCKPIYLGFCVLELSKLLMYETFYEVFLPKWGDDLELLYMDTDSFVVNVKTDDVYEDLKELEEDFDFSNYPADHHLFSETNKKVVGKFKDELGGDIMKEWIALRSKCYAFTTLEKGSVEKGKGVPKHVLPKFNEYKKILFEMGTVEVNFTQLRSRKHQMNVLSQTKKALGNFDDKRFIHDDGVETSPIGNSVP